MDTSAILMTIRETSNYINIKEKTIYAKVEAKQIPHFKIGGLIRFKKDEIDQWIEEQRVGIGGDKPKRRLQGRGRAAGTTADRIARKIIDEETEKYYPASYGKSDRIEDLGKEVNHGPV
jgi:excisionase family DNA binding protein